MRHAQKVRFTGCCDPETPKTDVSLSEIVLPRIAKAPMLGPHRKELGTYSLQLRRQLTFL